VGVFLKHNGGFFEGKEKLFIVLYVFVWGFGGVTAVCAVLDFILISFHLWLIKKGITTYEYIVEKRGEEFPIVVSVNRITEKNFNFSLVLRPLPTNL